MNQLETKLIKNIEKIFKTEVTYFKLTDLGLTNSNYYFVCNDTAYLLRYPFIKHDASKELEIINAIKPLGIDISPIYFDKKSSVKITKFFDVETFDQTKNVKKIEKVAYLMRKLHNSNIKAPIDFDPFEVYQQYKNQVKENIDESIYEYEYILDKAKRLYNPTTLCHNDWVSGNILFKNDKTYLIDYEYAGNNDIYFDIASFLSENDINDQNTISSFLKIYFQREATEKQLEKLKLFISLNDLIWYFWALMMYQEKKEDIYLDIAQLKLTRLKKYN